MLLMRRWYALDVRARRATPVLAVATFAVTTTVATLVLGNAIGGNSCGAGWTGYVPIGSCVKAFWAAAFYIGPVIGLLAGACAAFLADRATQRAHRAN
jgi:hypothetical protein